MRIALTPLQHRVPRSTRGLCELENEGRETSRSVDGGIISEFEMNQKVIPIGVTRINKTAQSFNKRAVKALSLPIRLRVISKDGNPLKTGAGAVS